ncbi:membrane protein implicated in regulation of membrane protease activity [Paucimonas lemoignei]|uniref:Membrane protein implicated in regulation of membrane protease activity n=1 Tax=Paucimonas lemoignei TaxID=29443 RepID=A0A4R3I658_PAULE|nr:NfeD family protein [Paucimonas lemoignei]TCS39519.1 membrane protein implicated in regulation of membrane protease activity [Paucimonas lemoignei]
MADWVMWLIMAATLVIVELFTGTFYLLMVAIGMAAGALVAVSGGALWAQLLAAAIVGASATLTLRQRRSGKSSRFEAANDPNINLDIGQTVAVPAWNEQPGAHPSARVMYRGAQWDVELAPGHAAVPGVFKIVEVRGSRLILAGGPA